jgi:DNA-binding response OmpR family regulator
MALILLAEDDVHLRSAYQQILEKENFEVMVAENGEVALTLAEAREPDLILLDMLMPILNGIDFLKRYDIINKHPHVKVLIFSNLSQPEKINEAVSLGATNYLTKAFTSPKKMVEQVRQALSS